MNQIMKRKIVIDLEKTLEADKRKNLKAFKYFQAEWSKFASELENSSENIELNTDMEKLHNEITRSLTSAAKAAIPLVTILDSRVSNLPPEILAMNTLKNRLYRKYNKNKSAINWANLETVRGDLIEAIEIFKSSQWNNFLNNIGPNPFSSAPFWRRINRMRSKKRQNNIGTVTIEGVELERDEDKANAFADFRRKTKAISIMRIKKK